MKFITLPKSTTSRQWDTTKHEWELVDRTGLRWIAGEYKCARCGLLAWTNQDGDYLVARSSFRVGMSLNANRNSCTEYLVRWIIE